MSQCKVLVLGAEGFVGKSFTRILSNNGIVFVSGKELGIDITRSETFDSAYNGEFSHVVHLAGKTFVPDSWKFPEEFLKVNALGTQNVVNFCHSNSIHLIFISAYIYGNVSHPIVNENQPLNANNPYALSKKIAEEICLFYKHNLGLALSIIRPFNVYGPFQKDTFLIPQIIKSIKTENRIQVKSLTPKRDYIYVDDLSNMILKIIQSNKQGIYNAGFGKSFSVQEVISVIQNVLNTNFSILSEEVSRVNEIDDTVADISKANSELNWFPLVDLKEGIRKLVSDSEGSF